MRISRMLNIGLVLAAVAYGVFQWSQRSSGADATKADAGSAEVPPPDLKQFIAHATEIYRGQDFAEIVKLMPPQEVQILQPRGKNLSLDELAGLLRERPTAYASADINLRELQAVQGKIPEMQDDGTRAVYKLDTPISGQTQVVFVKIGDRWYMP
jgi:hypothetical protein